MHHLVAHHVRRCGFGGEVDFVLLLDYLQGFPHRVCIVHCQVECFPRDVVLDQLAQRDLMAVLHQLRAEGYQLPVAQVRGAHLLWHGRTGVEDSTVLDVLIQGCTVLGAKHFAFAICPGAILRELEGLFIPCPRAKVLGVLLHPGEGVFDVGQQVTSHQDSA